MKDEAYHFSISHCGDYAGVIVSKNRKVGIDIELFTPKIERIAHKFVTNSEWAIVSGNGKRETSDVSGGKSMVNSEWSMEGNALATSQRVNMLTLLWSCKEALFKWYGLGEVGFIRHMELKQLLTTGQQQYELGFLFKKEKDLLLGLHSRFFNDLVLSYCCYLSTNCWSSSSSTPSSKSGMLPIDAPAIPLMEPYKPDVLINTLCNCFSLSFQSFSI